MVVLAVTPKFERGWGQDWIPAYNDNQDILCDTPKSGEIYAFTHYIQLQTELNKFNYGLLPY